MNRRLCLRIGSVLGCVLCWQATGGESATAAAVSPPGVPMVVPPPTPLPPVVTAGTLASAITPAVHAFVTAQVANLQSTQGPVVTAARTALGANCPRGGSATFRTVYTTELNAVALALLSNPATPLPVKVNLGVVMTQVGTNANTVQMDRAIEALLADRSDGAALAGIHAARPLVVTLITQAGGPGKTTLFAAVVGAVKAHPTGNFAGFIAVDAYRTLVVKPDNVQGLAIALVRQKLPPLYDPVMDLLAVRTAQYAKGVVPDPEAEAIVPTFLTRDFTPAPPAAAPLMTVRQQQRAVQSMVDLLSAIGQRAAPVTDRVVLGQLRDTVKVAAGALNVMSNQPNLFSGASGLGLVVTGPAMAQACSAVPATATIPFKSFAVYPGGPTLFPNGIATPPTLPPLPPSPAAPAATPAAR